VRFTPFTNRKARQQPETASPVRPVRDVHMGGWCPSPACRRWVSATLATAAPTGWRLSQSERCPDCAAPMVLAPVDPAQPGRSA